MTKRKFKPGRGYTKADWNSVDSPELSDAQIAKGKPFVQALPEAARKILKKLAGRPKLAAPKQAISIRLDPGVVEKFKATGPKWQSRINDVLKRAKV
ncbi:BrnA antitoxin family protein [soil metagenome]